ncbi:MAG TPA: TrkH family potassium uptake protein [Nevskiaceae bacterium]|nr:TrkH family potassium uptake protein [Nevskiaceae bacterium]
MPQTPIRRNTSVHRFITVQRITGLLLMVFSLTMLPPLAVDLWMDEDTTGPFVAGFLITLITGAGLWLPARSAHAELKVRDGFLITVLFWAVLGLFGAIPLYFADEAWHSYTEAVFESVSGLTTTGATTVAKGLDELPHSLNYYRVQLHWLGGMGIIVLAVAVLPMLGIGGMQLYRAETPGPMKNAKLTPRITETARVLWLLYAALTALCFIIYWALGMSAFDALCHAFSTLSTGGFSTHDASIGWFDSLGIEIACMVFMLIGSANFALHFLAWQRLDPRVYWRDGEFRAYIAVLIGFGLLICIPLILAGTYEDWTTAVRKGLFQLVAYGTTAGFATADPTSWPHFVPMLLLLSAFMFSCSGSTGGGVKMIRLVLFVRQALRELQKLIHPSAEVAIKYDGKVVPNEIVYAVGGFFSVYIGMTILLTFVMVATGLDVVTAFSAVAATINNMGPGLGSVNANVAVVSDVGKWVMIFAMLLGRLEIFTLLVIFTPSFWRR